MKTLSEAKALAEEMTKIGNNAGRRTVAVVSDMDQPLGCAVGNALEVKEAIDTLNGRGPKDFVELVMTLGAQMLIAGGKAENEKDARKMLQKTIDDRSALKKLAEFVAAQGGDSAAVYNANLLPRAPIIEPVFVQDSGYIEHIECDEIGICSLMLGGGRETKDSEIDLSVGIVLTKKVGEYVEQGDFIAYIHGNDHEKIRAAKKRLLNAYTFSMQKPEKTKLIVIYCKVLT